MSAVFEVTGGAARVGTTALELVVAGASAVGSGVVGAASDVAGDVDVEVTASAVAVVVLDLVVVLVVAPVLDAVTFGDAAGSRFLAPHPTSPVARVRASARPAAPRRTRW